MFQIAIVRQPALKCCIPSSFKISHYPFQPGVINHNAIPLVNIGLDAQIFRLQ